MVDEVCAENKSEKDDRIYEVSKVYKMFLTVQNDVYNFENDNKDEQYPKRRMFDYHW